VFIILPLTSVYNILFFISDKIVEPFIDKFDNKSVPICIVLLLKLTFKIDFIIFPIINELFNPIVGIVKSLNEQFPKIFPLLSVCNIFDFISINVEPCIVVVDDVL